ncbi:MAG: winged helix-turn-helix transcriptional regulator [Pseudonocardiales bacterium]|jgi:DNA-binding MarR family transcriptional regulator|nr:winged helix-turn-helix transcriptional regulator [Pseudonocardiales bacterium]MBV9651800.1 winged helix-turn-helix transcriptional regulator [Pseudonocardiales bacterium]
MNPSGAPTQSYRRSVTSVDQTVLAEELMTTMAALRRLIRRRVPTEACGPPLRGAHVELLQVIKKQPGIGIASAGRALHLAANSVSTLVNQLIDIGMLERQTAPDDRRAARLWLTDTAKQQLEAFRQVRVDLVAEGVAGLPDTDRQALTKAVPALRALLAALDVEEDASGSLRHAQPAARPR